MQYSSDEISVDSDHVRRNNTKGLKYLAHWPAVNIEFQDLVYTVPDISGMFFVLKKSRKKVVYKKTVSWKTRR